MSHFMNRVAGMALLSMLLAGAAHGQQSSPLEATLIIPDTEVLPGVPFEMWIEIRNPSETDVTVGLFPRLLVRPQGGESFEISPRTDDYPVLLKGAPRDGEPIIEYLTLAPGDSKTLTLPVRDSLRGAQFFADYRLSPPGRYALAVRLDPFPSDVGTQRVPVTHRGSVTTNWATVDRVEPTGSDAKVWQRMQEVAGGRWTVPMRTITETPGRVEAMTLDEAMKRWALFEEIVTSYPDSAYVPYAVVAQSGRGENYLKRVVETINRFPTSPVIDLLQLKAWGLTASTCGLTGDQAAICDRARAELQQSKRPTTQMLFGRRP